MRCGAGYWRAVRTHAASVLSWSVSSSIPRGIAVLELRDDAADGCCDPLAGSSRGEGAIPAEGVRSVAARSRRRRRGFPRPAPPPHSACCGVFGIYYAIHGVERGKVRAVSPSLAFNLHATLESSANEGTMGRQSVHKTSHCSTRVDNTGALEEGCSCHLPRGSVNARKVGNMHYGALYIVKKASNRSVYLPLLSKCFYEEETR